MIKVSQSPASNVAVTAVVALVLLACAVVMGLIASTANVMIVGLGVGAVAGAMLLAAPKVALFAAVGLGLTTPAVFNIIGPSASKMTWGIVLLSYALLLPSVMRLLSLRRLPMFAWAYLLFAVYAVTVSVFMWNGAGETISGFKRYFEGAGVMFALIILPLAASDLRVLRRIIVGVLVLQLPFVLYEYLVLVPMRAGRVMGSQVTDVIAGTFGANLVGGSPNAEMAMFVLIALGFCLAHWRAGTLRTRHFVALVIAATPCLTLGEVKVVILLFPLIAVVMYRHDVAARPGRYLPLMAVFAVITLVLGYIYLGVMGGTDGDVGRAFADAMRYNVEEMGYGNYVLNRSTVLSFWWKAQGLHDPIGFFFGHGIGSTFDSGDPMAVTGHIALRYPMYGVGLTSVSTLLWDVGVLGLILLLAVFVIAWLEANRICRHTDDVLVRYTAHAIQAALAVVALCLAYNSGALNIMPIQIVLSLVLGLLGRLVLEFDTRRT